MSRPVKTVGLIGLGNAGGPVAERLLQAHYRLKVFDLSAEKVEAFERRGAIKADSPADAVGEITIVLLPSAVEVRAAVYGERGVLIGMKPGHILMDLSGTDPGCARELEEKVVRQSGRFLGGTVHAAGAPAITIPQGKFSIVIGGNKVALDDSIDILTYLAKKIICVPESWVPKSMKLAIIMLATIETVATAEIMAWLLSQDIEPRMFRDVLRATGSNSFQRVEEFFRRNESTGGTLSNIRKDLCQLLSVAREVKVPLLMTALADQISEMAAQHSSDRIRPAAAFSTLYEVLAHVDMSQSLAEANPAPPSDTAESKVIYIGNFQE